MTAVNPSRLGQINLAGSTDALWIRQFPGEVMVAFQENNVFLDKHIVVTISQGRSAQFPAFGKTTARYHTPGSFIAGTPIASAERVINVDDLLLADVSIANIDEAFAHYDFRGPYATELGSSLARQFDTNVARNMVLAARSGPTVTGLQGGSFVTNANLRVDGELLAAAIYEAGVNLDLRDVPETERYAFMRPLQYALLAQTSKVTNKDTGGMGSYADGTVLKINGISLIKTNNLPQANDTANTNIPVAYRADYTNVAAIVAHKTSVGTLKLLDLAMESEYLIQNQATLMVAKYAMGHGILRPEGAVELRVA